MSERIDWTSTLAALEAVLRDVRVTDADCASLEGIDIGRFADAYYFVRPTAERCAGRVVAALGSTDTLAAGTVLGPEEIRALRSSRELPARLRVRSPLTCEVRPNVCSACYGSDPESLRPADIGAAVGLDAVRALAKPRRAPFRRRPGFLIAAVPTIIKSRGGGVVRFSPLPPGMELVSGRDYDSGGSPCLVLLDREGSGEPLHLTVEGPEGETYAVGNETRVLVEEGQPVRPGQPLASIPFLRSAPFPRSSSDYRHVALRLEGGTPSPGAKLNRVDGRVSVAEDSSGKTVVRVTGEDSSWCLTLDNEEDAERLNFKDGDQVAYGEILLQGWPDYHDVLDVLGEQEAAAGMLFEIQSELEQRRVLVEDRHLELILAQMFGWIRVLEVGGTDLRLGDFYRRHEFVNVNERTLDSGGAPARGVPLLLGISEVRERLRRAAG